LVEAFTSSVTVDRRLYAQDIQGSIAHCKTLEKARVLTQTESRTIVRALETVKLELDRGKFKFSPHDEDIHMAVERRLTELIGPLGGKLHTGRSRNDQVALDVRLYLRHQLEQFAERVADCQRVLVAKAKANRTVAMPGYTHLQRAQPVLFAHHLLAYVDMFERDKGRILDAQKRLNVMPLGSGALAGTNYPVDRRYTAGLLGFPRVTTNSLDAVSDRDFMIEIAAALSITMMHLSRLSEELILWSSQEFRFVDLPEGFCTGSSMMPQKKNPDVPELVRGKTGRVYGQLMNLLTTMKALPLSYNRDLQEDKPAVFDALDTVTTSLEVLTELMRRLKVNREALKQAVQGGGLLATELADYLVTKGIPFREAHAITGRVVRTALERGLELSSLSLQELRQFSERFDQGVFTRLTVEAAIDRKAQIGGTARGQVEQRIRELERMLSS
jgi:argininosuccinate lyase